MPAKLRKAQTDEKPKDKPPSGSSRIRKNHSSPLTHGDTKEHEHIICIHQLLSFLSSGRNSDFPQPLENPERFDRSSLDI